MQVNFDPFQAVLLDLDGTVYHEDHPLPGAIELLRKLKAEGRNYACLSNSPSSPQRVSARLKIMGVEVEPQRIYTAGRAAVDFVLDRWGPGARIFNLCTEGLQSMLQDAKAHLVQSPDEPCDAIIIGAMVNVYATEARQLIALLLARRVANLIGICADRVYPSKRGLEFGSGAFSTMLAYAADKPVQFVGKPLPVFFHNLCHRLQIDPARCVLIGDNIESDVMGAKSVGMKSILTLTGVTHREDLPNLPPDRHPDFVVDTLTELL